MLRLVIEDDEGKTTVVPLIRDEITIGRKEGNTIRLTERNVSRRHARLLRTESVDPTVLVEDLDSYNGVRLNGQKISDKATIRPGDLVQIGDYSLALKVDEPTGVTPAPIEATTRVFVPTGSEQLATEAQAHMVVVSSNLAGETYTLDRREILLGRIDENDVVINHRSISRNHAKIIHRDGAFTIIDLASSNGVKVNSEAFGTASLVNGDIVELGHVKMRYVAPGDDYVFSPADIDDVVLDAGLPMGRLLFFLFLLLAAAVAAYFFIQPVPAPSGQATTAPIAAPVTNAQPPPSAPPKAEGLPVEDLLKEGRQHLELRAWREASGVFGRILQDQPKHPEARRLRDQATAEEANERTHSEILRDIEDKQFGDAFFQLADFPKTSVYSPELADKRALVERGYAQEALERGRRLLSPQNDEAGATKVQAELAGYPFAKSQAAELMRLIREHRKQAQAPVLVADAPPVKRPMRRRASAPASVAPAPVAAGPGYETLLADARKLIATNDRVGAVGKLEQALKVKKAKVPYQMLCTLYPRIGRLEKALTACKMWKAKETRNRVHPLIEEKIQQLEDQLSH